MKLNRMFAAFGLSCLLFLGCASPAAHAVESVIDTTKQGSISVTMKHEGKAVTGGSLKITRVAEISDNQYQLTKNFQDSGLDLKKISSAETAKAAASYAEKKKIAGTIVKADNNGTVKFDKLVPGLYLVTQPTAISGYNKIESFLVSLPQKDSKGVYQYDVDATPKMELKKTPTTPPKTPPKTPKGKLPKTGQLNWPIPLLSIAGMGIFAAGWFLSRNRKPKQ